jgi:hypothetical protein
VIESSAVRLPSPAPTIEIARSALDGALAEARAMPARLARTPTPAAAPPPSPPRA